jgi:hypothetical protein
MTQIHRAFVALLILLTALWLLANGTLPQPLTYFSFRAWFIQYSGVLAIGVMSVAMILATRPAWLEALLLAGGSVSALASLTGRIGRDRRWLRVVGQGAPERLFHLGGADAGLAVVPEQTDAMVRAMRAVGGRVEQWLFEDEGHGFRDRRNQARMLVRLHRFYRRACRRAGAGGTKLS